VPHVVVADLRIPLELKSLQSAQPGLEKKVLQADPWIHCWLVVRLVNVDKKPMERSTIFLMGKSTNFRLGHGFNSYVGLPEGNMYIYILGIIIPTDFHI